MVLRGRGSEKIRPNSARSTVVTARIDALKRIASDMARTAVRGMSVGATVFAS